MRGNPGAAECAPGAGAGGRALDGLTDSEYTPNRSDPFGVSYEMATYRRTLDLTLPRGQSAFLWGPRKTGKSTLLRQSFPRRRAQEAARGFIVEVAKSPYGGYYVRSWPEEVLEDPDLRAILQRDEPDYKDI